ncbi:hypothetical protein [Mucilaginibacter sp. dw_454]|uniref:serine O-acetyltransferase n=1 Tax=Mucilaginibacter sp. dw_454 TaxID=2720079 RepID=UPI001BD5884F|nr:hypothetical protein [Mucilaginibacter sp. dw_454]
MRLRETLKDIKSDCLYHRGDSFARAIGVYLFNPAFRILLNYRIGKYLLEHKTLNFLHRYYKYRQIRRGCQVSFKCTIGKNLLLHHPLGIIIGEGVIIKDNVEIYQQVTLGRSGRKGEENGYPVVEESAQLFAGAKIFGAITIGKNAKVGANAVVNKSVPENAIAVGNPAKIVER